MTTMQAIEQAAVAQDPPVVQAMNTLQARANQQREIVALLVERLEPVMGEPGPSTSAPSDTPDFPGNCFTTKRIMDIAEQVAEQTTSLARVLERLEI